MKKTFVNVEMLKDTKDASGLQILDYKQVFEKDNRLFTRIVIRGDPGSGKSTYVNKIAVDWAKNDEYLQKTFDFVFLIELQQLRTKIDDAIKELFSEEFQIFIETTLKQRKRKILIILDGFDEITDEQSSQFESVMEVLRGNMLQYFTVLVTSRQSHIDKIPPNAKQQCLLVKGFDDESVHLFLQKQNVEFPSNRKLTTMFKNPLLCAIYCSLRYRQWKNVEMEDDFNLIKGLVDNSVITAKEMKNLGNIEQQLEEMGKFALTLVPDQFHFTTQKVCVAQSGFGSCPFLSLTDIFFRTPKNMIYRMLH